MPFNELRHRPSFPPTIVHLTHPHPNTNKPLPPRPHDLDLDIDSIDANPISFFLTTPTPDEDDDDESIDYFEGDDYDNDIFDEDLSAGIEGSEEDLRSKEVREVSPSSLQREALGVTTATTNSRENIDQRPLLDRDFEDDVVDSEVDFGFAMPLSLKDFVGRGGASRGIVSEMVAKQRDLDARLSSRSGYLASSPLSSPPSSPPTRSRALGFDIPEFKPKPNSNNDRGRGRVKLTPSNQTHPNNYTQSTAYLATSPPRRTHSLSPKPRKPVSWRVPSRAIWRIDEEVGEIGGVVYGLSSSAPTLGGGILRNGNGNSGASGGNGGNSAGMGSGNGGQAKKVKKQVRWADFQ